MLPKGGINKMIKNPNYVPNIFPGNPKQSDNPNNKVDDWYFAPKE